MAVNEAVLQTGLRHAQQQLPDDKKSMVFPTVDALTMALAGGTGWYG